MLIGKLPPTVQVHRRSKEHSRSTSAMSAGDERSEPSENLDHRLSQYSEGFGASSVGKPSLRRQMDDVFEQRVIQSK